MKNNVVNNTHYIVWTVGRSIDMTLFGQIDRYEQIEVNR